MSDRDDYRFLKVADAKNALNQRVNLIGIIAEHSSRSRGTEFFCSLRIVDETCKGKARGILVDIFAESQEKLPQVKAAGDIVIISQVVMKHQNRETYALFNKKFSSFALYKGIYSESCIPYQASSNFHLKNQEMTVVGLRKWVDTFELNIVSKKFVLLSHVKEGQCHGLLCKAKSRARNSCERKKKINYIVIRKPRLKSEKENPLPVQLEPQPLARDILKRFPSVGTIFRVFVNYRNVKQNIFPLTAGRWVNIINLQIEIHEGLWYGVLMSSTEVYFINNENLNVLERLRDFEKRLSSKFGRMPTTSFPWPCRITEVADHVEEVPVVTLMDILTYPQVTAKFRCIVRVVASLPWTVEDICTPDGTYRIRLTLEDPTGRIHSYLYADNGEVFFGGYPPLDALTQKWNTLLGVTEVDSGCVIENVPRNPPWIMCCIKSYYVDKKDVWGSRKYQIFGTRLVC